MDIRKGRPEIKGSDYPNTIYRALLGSVAVWFAEQSYEATSAWTKISADAAEAILDGFAPVKHEDNHWNPEGSARLYMSIDQLEYALVGYGNDLIEINTMESDRELAVVDELLKTIDGIKTD